MKRLFFFMIFMQSMQYSFCADSSAQPVKKSSVYSTLIKALDKWWNEDTGTVCEKIIRTDHEKQEAQENFFYCDMSSCDRRDVRRAIGVIGLSCAVGSIAMPHLAVSIVGTGAISTSALGLPLILYKAPDDPREKTRF